MTSRVAIATALALATALFYAISNVLELSEAEKVPDEYAMRPASAAAPDQGAALAAGSALRLRGLHLSRGRARSRDGRVRRTDPRARHSRCRCSSAPRSCTGRCCRSDWIAAGVLSGGLALFLYEVSPTGGRQIARTREWLIAGPSAVGAIVLCMVIGRATKGPAPRRVPGRCRGHRVRRVRAVDQGARPLSRRRALRLGSALGAVRARGRGDRRRDRCAERAADRRTRRRGRVDRVDERDLRARSTASSCSTSGSARTRRSRSSRSSSRSPRSSAGSSSSRSRRSALMGGTARPIRRPAWLAVFGRRPPEAPARPQQTERRHRELAESVQRAAPDRVDHDGDDGGDRVDRPRATTRPSCVKSNQRRRSTTDCMLGAALGLRLGGYPRRRPLLHERHEPLDHLVAVDRLLEGDLVDRAVARVDQALQRHPCPGRGVQQIAHDFLGRRIQLLVRDDACDEPCRSASDAVSRRPVKSMSRAIAMPTCSGRIAA